MEHTKKFQEVTSCNAIKINSEVDRKYLIVHAQRIVTKFGPTILLSIRDSSFNVVKVFMPKRYSSVFLDEDIDSINNEKFLLNLIYKGTCIKSKSYILSVEK
jgi:hypothetical protein